MTNFPSTSVQFVRAAAPRRLVSSAWWLGFALLFGCSTATQTPAQTPETEEVPPPPSEPASVGEAPEVVESADAPPPEEEPTERVVTGSPCPAYPAAVREAGIEGEVTVRYTVTKEGLPEDIKALSGPDELRKACVDSITYASFPPKVEAGEPVATVHEKTCTFRLPEKEKKSAESRGEKRRDDAKKAQDDAVDGAVPESTVPVDDRTTPEGS